MEVADGADGPAATLTSVAPHTEPVAAAGLDAALAAPGWSRDELDPAPDRLCGRAAPRARGDHMARLDLTTLQLVHRRDAATFAARNPFPPGGVLEDPATGAAAATLDGYLRELGAVEPPAEITIHQGGDMGRPNLLHVAIPVAGGIRVTGTAVPIA